MTKGSDMKALGEPHFLIESEPNEHNAVEAILWCNGIIDSQWEIQ